MAVLPDQGETATKREEKTRLLFYQNQIGEAGRVPQAFNASSRETEASSL